MVMAVVILAVALLVGVHKRIFLYDCKRQFPGLLEQ